MVSIIAELKERLIEALKAALEVAEAVPEMEWTAEGEDIHRAALEYISAQQIVVTPKRHVNQRLLEKKFLLMLPEKGR